MAASFLVPGGASNAGFACIFWGRDGMWAGPLLVQFPLWEEQDAENADFWHDDGHEHAYVS